MKNILKSKHFRPLPEPVNTGDYTILGIFPYETAAIHNTRLPRILATGIENVWLPSEFRDNKIVIVCEVNQRFDTEDFAVFCKDSKCSFGTWNEIIGYGGKTL